MLPACCGERRNTHEASIRLPLCTCVYSACVEFTLNLVDLGLDEEELDERGCAVDGRVDVLQSQAGLVYEVKVLCQEILYPQQGGGGLLLPIICTHVTVTL